LRVTLPFQFVKRQHKMAAADARENGGFRRLLIKNASYLMFRAQ
jgi:hypothetical protein